LLDSLAWLDQAKAKLSRLIFQACLTFSLAWLDFKIWLDFVAWLDFGLGLTFWLGLIFWVGLTKILWSSLIFFCLA
jgi:hypothetical protein